jgi:quinol monooxygenase YgiN
MVRSARVRSTRVRGARVRGARVRGALVLLVSLLAVTAAFAQAPPAPAATMRVAFFEVGPNDVGRVAAALKDYRQAALKASGIVRVDVLQQIGRPNHFAIEEAWRDAASLEAHKSAAETKKLDETVKATRVSPFDERLLAGVSVAAPGGTIPAQAIYVLTHADSVPDGRNAAASTLADIASKSRQEPGNVMFQVTVQTNRNNHFTLIEAWRDEKAYDAHVTADATKKFRDAFAPFSGALFDERIYKGL